MGLFSSFFAGKAGQSSANNFAYNYQQNFGTPLPSAAKDAVQSAITIMSSFSGTGRESYGAEKLNAAIGQYVNAVGRYNHEKVAAGLAAMLGYCMNRRGGISFGYKWAAEVILNNVRWYCPEYL